MKNHLLVPLTSIAIVLPHRLTLAAEGVIVTQVFLELRRINWIKKKKKEHQKHQETRQATKAKDVGRYDDPKEFSKAIIISLFKSKSHFENHVE